MLLAEIHGKRCLEAESNEDLLTSAVFGHLRFVRDASFWKAVFRRARTVAGSTTTLLEKLVDHGQHFTNISNLEVSFWPFFPGFGEPDLILRFASDGGKILLLLIEVKLFASKSECGERDQLKRYYDLLQDDGALGDLSLGSPVKALVYLTEKYSADEIRESISYLKSPLAADTMFGLQWQDVLEACQEVHPSSDGLLGELRTFLHVRRFERFRGFCDPLIDFAIPSAHFYQQAYFSWNFLAAIDVRGEFYGN